MEVLVTQVSEETLEQLEQRVRLDNKVLRVSLAILDRQDHLGLLVELALLVLKARVAT